jgi:DNA-binding MurR/RpiR family transcriptional regulator
VDIITRISEAYPHMSKGRKKIADYVTDHAQQAVFMTAAKLGATTGNSESTVVRFAIFLGYEGYPEFQHALELLVQDKMDSVGRTFEHFDGSDEEGLLQEVLTSDADRIRNTITRMDPAAFASAVDIILQAKHLYIVGIRSCEPLASFLHFYLNMVRGDNILVGTTSTSEMFEQMIRIGAEDAVIGISFPRYSMRTLKCMEFANDRNAKVIAITDSVHSPMNLYSSCNLFAQSDSISIVDSLVAPLSVINALIVAICLRCPDEVRKDLKTLENTWNNYQVYLNDEINFIGEEPVLTAKKS